eukprot:scaffold9420_cov63-Isochrysis_galbana.AAC.2
MAGITCRQRSASAAIRSGEGRTPRAVSPPRPRLADAPTLPASSPAWKRRATATSECGGSSAGESIQAPMCGSSQAPGPRAGMLPPSKQPLPPPVSAEPH